MADVALDVSTGAKRWCEVEWHVRAANRAIPRFEHYFISYLLLPHVTSVTL